MCLLEQIDKREKLLCKNSWEKELRRDFQVSSSMQKEGWRSSRHRAKVLCSPGEPQDGAGCPAAAQGHHTEHISICNHKGVCSAAVDVAWKRLQPTERDATWGSAVAEWPPRCNINEALWNSSHFPASLGRSKWKKVDGRRNMFFVCF